MTGDDRPQDAPATTAEYRRVELRSGTKLVRVPNDPLEALCSAASEEFASASMVALRRASLKAAREETETETADE